ncbi:MAG TPA: MBL fold metallo-hydrolase [Clostridia bacterium]|nr:MBL fold metallo-hydrolase [Clostridia bacterium]
MAKFCVLASSSAGNSTYISCASGALLVDAGISCRRIVNAIAETGESAAALSAVLITHEHTDHIKGLCNLVKKTGAAVYATGPVLSYIVEHNCVPAGATLIEVTSRPFEAAGMRVQAFATPHDSVASVGYRLTLPNEQTVAVATDLGRVTDEVMQGVMGCRTVLLEANYDPQLLRMGPYPYFLKQRIASSNGHLDNGSSAAFAAALVESGTVQLFLGHLSRENNNPALAEQTVAAALAETGAQRDLDFELDVAPYDNLSRLVRF